MSISRKCDLVREPEGGLWRLRFRAMGSPCEILLDEPAAELPETVFRALLAGQQEAERIEQKYSRYRPDSVLSRINATTEQWQQVDPETAHLLDFAGQCHDLSEGLFDVTAGVLRAIWKFGSDGQTHMPEPSEVAALLPRLGWQQVEWAPPRLWLPAGMALDFGGIGKEYAVDRVLAHLQAQVPQPCLVNFGGDLRASAGRVDGKPWLLGIEQPEDVRRAAGVIGLHQGALATSGDTRRYVDYQGQRYGHILNPKTGWPVVGAPRSVTVAAPTCTEAGMIATFAMLQGSNAEAFLQAQGVRHWVC